MEFGEDDSRRIKRRKVRALQLEKDLGETQQKIGHTSWQQAAILRQIHDETLHGFLGHPTFKGFVQAKCPFGFSKANKLVQISRKFQLELGIQDEVLVDLLPSKAILLVPTINEENVSELIDFAKSHSVREISRHIRTQRTANEEAKTDNEGCLVESPSSEADNSAGSVKRALVIDSTNASGRFHPSKAIKSRIDETEWMTYLSRKPKEDDFYIDDFVWEQAIFASTRGKTILLSGPAGCGKSELARRVAEVIGLRFEQFNLGNCSDARSMFLGAVHLMDGETRFFKSQFARGFETGNCCFLLDELNRCHPDAANILLPALDEQAYLACDELPGGERVDRGQDICFFATANIGAAYTGTETLDHALNDRQFCVIEMDFSPAIKEAKILMKRNRGLEKADAQRLTRIAEEQRRLFREGDFSVPISTRILLAAAEQIAANIPFDRAFQFCVINKFPSDGFGESERSKLQQLMQKF